MQNFSRVCVRIDFIVFNKWIWVEWFMTSLICLFVSCGFVTDCQRGRLLGHMCFSCYRTYAMILCNWLILWQNALYLYLGKLRMCLTTSKTTFQDLVLKPSSLFKKLSKECKFIKTWQLVDTYSKPPICRGLRISYFNSDFLGIRESVYRPFFSPNPKHIKGLF